MFFSEFCETFCRAPPGDCFLCLPKDLENFFRTRFSDSTSGNYLISTSMYNKRLFHRCFSSIFYKNKNKPFEGAQLLKIPENYLSRS